MKQDKSKPKTSTQDASSKTDQQPRDPQRRRLLTGASVLGLSAGLLPLAQASSSCTESAPHTGQALSELPLPQQQLLLRKHVKKVLVIYAENRSFNNLFANYPGTLKPLSDLSTSATAQRDRDGSLLPHLPPIWKGMVPDQQVVNHKSYHITQDASYLSRLPNHPFPLQDDEHEALPQGVVTRDLWHVFYQNQMQINGGKNDQFVAWADSGALPMGYYGDSAYNLRLWALANQYTLCDNFFQGAFGGSFLNHQYLACAQPPFYPDVQNSPAKGLIANLVSDDPTDPRLKPLDDSPASALEGAPKFGPSQITPDGYAVNTMQPPYWPSASRDSQHPDYADAKKANTLPPQTHTHIGNKLTEKGVDWAWYAGGWQFALDGKKDSDQFPPRPDFQLHHQPFNYFADLGPEHPEARQHHLRDGGLGDSPATNHFIADLIADKLPPVTFYKPQGNLNMHAGYSDVEAGDRHIAHIINQLQNSKQWQETVVIVTFDENGGWWDPVAPPKGDRWGPGSRIPALVISPFARRGYVDHTQYDTGSILRFISRVYDLSPLPGLTARDNALRDNGHPPMGDLSAALQFPS